MSRLGSPIVSVLGVCALCVFAAPAWGQLQLPDGVYDITDDTPGEANYEGDGTICGGGASGDMTTYAWDKDVLTWNGTRYDITDGATGEPVGTAEVRGQDGDKWVVVLYNVNGGVSAIQYWSAW